MEQFYIVRAAEAGVFFGKVESRTDREITMTDVRKIFYWEGACAVEELAVHGTASPNKCKLTVIVPRMIIVNPIQIIPCTDRATDILSRIRVWKS